MINIPWLCGVGVGVEVGSGVAVGDAEGSGVTLGLTVGDEVTVSVDVSVVGHAVTAGSVGVTACGSEHPIPTRPRKTMTKSPCAPGKHMVSRKSPERTAGDSPSLYSSPSAARCAGVRHRSGDVLLFPAA